MNASTKQELAALHGQDEEPTNTSGNRSLMEVLEERLSRRTLLRGSVGSAGAAVMSALAG